MWFQFLLVWAVLIKEWTLCTSICRQCVPISRCPAVQSVFNNRPYLQHSYFSSAIVCGVVPLETLVCCDPKVIKRELVREAQLARLQKEQFDQMIGHHTEIDYQTDNVTDINKIDDQFAPFTEANHGLSNKINGLCDVSEMSRIVGGQEATPDAFPWVVRLGYTRIPHNHRGSGQASINSALKQRHLISYRCGGTLITNRHVLTAAHCLVRLPRFTVLSAVKLGTDGVKTEVHGIDLIAPHESYNTPRLQNDIGMVRLARPAELSSIIQPVCLPFDALRVDLSRLQDVSEPLIVAGYGTTSAESTDMSPTLRYVRLTYQPLERCSRIYRNYFNLTVGPGQICTEGEYEKDSCGGDSGGSLFLWRGMKSSVAVGLVSFGALRCGTEGIPTVYTDIQAFEYWIKTKVDASEGSEGQNSRTILDIYENK